MLGSGRRSAVGIQESWVLSSIWKGGRLDAKIPLRDHSLASVGWCEEVEGDDGKAAEQPD
jgi:hypothetical protein